MNANKWTSIAVVSILAVFVGVVTIVRFTRRAPAVIHAPSISATNKITRVEPGYRAQSPPPIVASDKEIDKAVASMTVKSIYKSYRTAVVSGNKSLQVRLWNVLYPDRMAAAAFADEDAKNAKTEDDRRIAREISDSLRR